MNIEFDNIFQLNTDNQDIELDTYNSEFILELENKNNEVNLEVETLDTDISISDNNKQELDLDLDTSTSVDIKSSDHNKLINRDMKNQHPIGAITSLTEELLSRPNTEIPDSFINTL